jgi:predicted phosphodiesterase
MALSLKRCQYIKNLVDQIGLVATAEKEGLKTESIRRCIRFVRQAERKKDLPPLDNENLLQRISERYSEKELRLLARGNQQLEETRQHVHDFTGETVRVGYMSDLHIGSIYTDDSFIMNAREEFAKENVDMVVVAGDVTEGMSNRPGHIYECSELGYDAQKEKAVELLSNFDFCPLYTIDGNHDQWYIKSNGAKIVKDICSEIDSAEFLGHDEGDIIINGVTIKLWHGKDSSSYAISYRLQKLIESLSGGEKPHVLIAGHVHKAGWFFIRNIQAVGSGAIQRQSKWMRSKRISSHTGFGICDITINDSGVGKFANTFYPFYV